MLSLARQLNTTLDASNPNPDSSSIESTSLFARINSRPLELVRSIVGAAEDLVSPEDSYTDTIRSLSALTLVNATFHQSTQALLQLESLQETNMFSRPHNLSRNPSLAIAPTNLTRSKTVLSNRDIVAALVATRSAVQD